MQDAIATGVRQLEEKNAGLTERVRRYEVDAEEKSYRLEHLEHAADRQE